jgi:hypothetical protein
MRRPSLGVALAGALCLAIAACAFGLEPYSVCADCEALERDGGKDAMTLPDVAVVTCDGESCAPEEPDGCEGDTCDACDGDTCDAPISPPGLWSCTKGGCNAAGGACSAQGQGCYCTSDSSCLGGRCVKLAGKNDVSCASCSGSGPADGFGCQLGRPGIPALCTSSFGYTPSNLTAQQLAALAPVGAVDLTCSGTVTFNGSQWSGATCSQTLPAATTIPQSGGPSIDVLAFQRLTIAAGVALNLTGSNAVMLVVFGDATVSGTIHADGAPGATSILTAGTSGPGGGYSCGASAGGNGMNAAGTCNSPYNTDPCRPAGGGGGGASTSGGAGNMGIGGTGGTGGNSRSNTMLVPLYGGCPGGNSAGYACTTSGGGGGGAVQISVSGTLTISAGGAVSANGGTGGTSGCSAVFGGGSGLPYPGAGGGGGAGGAVLLEGQTVTVSGATSVNGGSGGDAQAGGGRGPGSTSASAAGASGNLSTPSPTSYAGGAGGGGGGGYGYTRVNNARPAGTYACPTTLSPAPTCSSDHGACVCVDDGDCSSGKCMSSGQCTGRCSGVGDADTTRCEIVTASTTSDAGDAGVEDAGAE